MDLLLLSIEYSFLFRYQTVIYSPFYYLLCLRRGEGSSFFFEGLIFQKLISFSKLNVFCLYSYYDTLYGHKTSFSLYCVELLICTPNISANQDLRLHKIRRIQKFVNGDFIHQLPLPLPGVTYLGQIQNDKSCDY